MDRTCFLITVSGLIEPNETKMTIIEMSEDGTTMKFRSESGFAANDIYHLLKGEIENREEKTDA